MNLPLSFVELFFMPTQSVFKLTGDKLNKRVSKIQSKPPLAPKPTQFKNYKREVVDQRGTYYFSRNNNTKLVIYIHGGGFIMPITNIHWNYIDFLAKNVSADFLVPKYPLSPHYFIDDMLKYIDSLTNKFMNFYDEIILIGDSAGASLCLEYSQSVYYKDTKLNKIIAVSPLVDSALNNPQIKEVAKTDKLLAIESLPTIQKWVARNHPFTSPIVSPIYGDFTALDVTVISSTNDILNPDVRRFIEKHTNVKYFECKNMPHIFPLLPYFNESREVNQEILRILNS